MSQEALIVFAHGARTPSWADPLQRICALIRLRQPGLRVELAFLELMSPLIADSLQQLAAEGVGRVTIVPAFMAPGGHVQKDLPALVALVQAQHPGLEVVISPAIGESEAVMAAIADYAVGVMMGKPV